MLLLSLVLALALATAYVGSAWGLLLLALPILAATIIGRALFYVLVIPTTMPGAFFWKNPGFVEHARETGLADMPQLGVVYERHHAFEVGELLDTVTTTSLAEKIAQAKRVFTG